MRSGLLAVGVILLVLGAIFYFVPTPASATDTESVSTTTYATMDNETNETETTSFTTRTTTSDTQVVFDDGDSVAYVYLDENGDMYNEDGQFLGAGIGDAGTTRVSDTYAIGTSDTVSDSSWDAQDGGWDQSDVTTTSDSGVATQTTTDSQDGFNDPDTFGDAEDDGLGVATVADETENAAESAAGFGGNWLRTLSILSMVLGAILTILGLVLPNRDYYDTRARTAGPAGRRVRYEREEERHVRK